MQIRCKTCGQLIYVPENQEGKTTRCPSCLDEFIYSSAEYPEAAPAPIPGFSTLVKSEKFSESDDSTAGEMNPPQGSLPSPRPLVIPNEATREWYHQPRILTTHKLTTSGVFGACYSVYSRFFWMILLYGLVSILPNLILALPAQFLLAPELLEIQQDIDSEASLSQRWNQYMEISQKIPTANALALNLILIATTVIQLLLMCGAIRFFNACGRNQKARFSLIFTCYDCMGRILLATIISVLTLIFTLVPCILILIPFAALGAPGISVFAGIFLYLSLISFMIFVLPLISDCNIQIYGAFRLSYLFSMRNFWTILSVLSLLLFIYFFFSGAIMSLFHGYFSVMIIGMVIGVFIGPMIPLAISMMYLNATGHFRLRPIKEDLPNDDLP